ncbi:MAG TPA: hypothetical protein VG889_03255 [Rhizomicrobium sp.]|nr:hypothetical protein [Rhizomicrobium sp.]
MRSAILILSAMGLIAGSAPARAATLRWVPATQNATAELGQSQAVAVACDRPGEVLVGLSYTMSPAAMGSIAVSGLQPDATPKPTKGTVFFTTIATPGGLMSKRTVTAYAICASAKSLQP